MAAYKIQDFFKIDEPKPDGEMVSASRPFVGESSAEKAERLTEDGTVIYLVIQSKNGLFV